MRRLKQLATASVLSGMLLALSGCLSQLIPEPDPAPQNYDFGPPPEERAEALRAGVRLTAVEAPSWLDSRDIRYRRLDEQPQALLAYARSRWVAAVPELFAQRLRQQLAQAASADRRSELVLRLEIERFEQVFTGPDDANVVLQAHAHVEDANGSVHVREVSLERASAPDADGATAELSVLADRAIDDLLEWLREIAGVRLP